LIFLLILLFDISLNGATVGDSGYRDITADKNMEIRFVYDVADTYGEDRGITPVSK